MSINKESKKNQFLEKKYEHHGLITMSKKSEKKIKKFKD